MKVELSVHEIFILRWLIKNQSVEDVRMSKVISLSEDTRKIFRDDFKINFNLFKKLDKALRSYYDSLQNCKI